MTIKPYARMRARKLIMQALYQWQATGANLNDIERQFIERENTRRFDVDYFKDLIHEIPACIDVLDEKMTPLLDRSLDELDSIELAILRIGVYELLRREDVPYQVTINEGVELAKTFGAEASHKYINGILDGLAKQLNTSLENKE